ncbi:DUF2281 domain-containing protein [Candidatus Magnetaquicoccus inordinatus]|uniref:DUF2281 domain-containing protein n=1 Tax=Candidatus Magnetaquicoccus inordinatus TaxID=2496818 RepID=UPI001D0E49D3|nr:DUF2281 domain-containing protein [Candidatus Magnetaquicoccus inordinatus]
MTIAERVYEQTKMLPDHLACEVLDFIGYLMEKEERATWDDLMHAQVASLEAVWDNDEDEVWDLLVTHGSDCDIGHYVDRQTTRC